MKPTLALKLPAAIVFAAACAMSTGAGAQTAPQPAAAQSAGDAKLALAVKLAQLQQKNDSQIITEQLTASAIQPMLTGWAQRLDETVPPARQKEVRDKLDVELKKFAETTQKVIESQIGKAAESALVPIFMDKLTEDEMRTIIAYLDSPVSAKYQSLGLDATNAWARLVVEATKSTVETAAKDFDAAANRIVAAATAAPVAAPTRAAPASAPARGAPKK